MKRIPLGRTEISVTDWCLGTMTYGNQTPEADAHAQIDRALGAGINFIDCAEMYPVNPVAKETAGRSEAIIGTWNARTRRRGDYVLATKIAGPKNVIRDEPPSSTLIPQTVEASLKRLQTDYIDLYQIHWPARGSYMFRQNWTYDPSRQKRERTIAHMEDVIDAMQREVEKGRIRAFGLSNESAWGTIRWIDVAERLGGPRVASVQNEYSLLCRLYDTDMAEMAVNEDVTLLAFSPLAAGYLTGKYQGGAVPAGSRRSLVPEMGGRMTERVLPVVQAYLDLARAYGVDPVHMAMAWQATRPFPISSIFGATTTAQLDHILKARDLTLSPELVQAINATHKAHPMPY